MKKRVLVGVITLAAALVCTAGFAAVNKQDAKASSFFSRTSVKKCAVTLSEDNYVWDGQAKEPEVRVNYLGEDLEAGVDYVVEYQNNVDSGTATVKVKGKGDYRGSQKAKFRIQGLDISKECQIEVNNDKVSVFFKGEQLPEGYYSVTKLETKKLISSIEGVDGFLNTYEVEKNYIITGKGAFEGTVTKKVKVPELVYER